MNGAYYLDSTDGFLRSTENDIFAQLTTGHLKNFSELQKAQEKSWKTLIKILRNTFTELQRKNVLAPGSGVL